MKKSLKIIRVLTVAPIMAFLLYTMLFIFRKEYFATIWHYVYSLACLTVLPLLAYPLQKFIPGFRDKGRAGQRSLAIIFAVAGYVLCALLGIIFSQSAELWTLTLTYLLSGICIFISSKVFKFKISGHACGVAGPCAALVSFGLYIPALFGIAVWGLAFYASLASKRHSLPELISGTVLPTIFIVLFSFLL